MCRVLLDSGLDLISLCMTLDHCMQSKEKACNHFLVLALKLLLLQPLQ